MPYKALILKKKKYNTKRIMRRKVVKKLTVSPVVKQYVANALNRRLENKVCPFVVGSNPTSQTDLIVIPLSTNTTAPFTITAPTVINLSNCWNISSGTGQADRVGNIISPKKWMISYYLHNNGSTNIPCLVRVIVFKLKSGFGVPFSTQPTDILQTGNTSSGGVGTYQDLNRPINEEKYSIYYNKVMKIGGSVAGTTIGNGNNDFSCVKHRRINLLKLQSHKIKYNDGTSAPTNSGLYMAFFFAPYGGNPVDNTMFPPSAGGSAGGVLALPQLSYDLVGEYEDA